MAFIPPDIWMHVAKFIPRKELSAMFAVNATFFDLAMDVRYRIVAIANFNEKSLKRILLLRDPAIAHRVRNLRLKKPNVSRKHPEPINGSAAHTSTAVPGTTDGDQPSTNQPHSEMEDMRLALQTLTDTVPYLVNVTELYIEQSDSYTIENDLRPFFTAACKAFGPRLEILDFGSYLPTLPSTADDFMSLRVLNVALLERHFPDKTVLATLLAPFINKVAPTLESLSLAFFGRDWQLPLLFGSLGLIPHLRLFRVFALFRVFGFSMPLGGGLTQFLRSNATTLRQVEFASYELMEYLYPFFSPVSEWLEENQNDEIILSNLHMLHIPIPHRRFDLIMAFVRRSAETLKTLCLPGCDLRFEEVKTLVSFPQFRTQLRCLYIHLERFTAEYIILFAQSLPCLVQLDLKAKYFGPPAAEVGRRFRRGELERRCMRDFVTKMRTYDFGRWKLLGIDIILSSDDIPGLYPTIKRVFAECIPSLVMISKMLREDVLAAEIYADLLP